MQSNNENKQVVEYASASQLINVDDTKVYTEMVTAVSMFFKQNLGDLINKHDELLRSLTNEDLKIPTTLTADEIKMAVSNRNKWIKIVSGMDNKHISEFILLTIYRNSGLSVLHISCLEQLSKDVITEYLNRGPNFYQMMLHHILVISRMMKHYDEAFSYGLINFMNRESTPQILTNNDNVFRISFMKLGGIALSCKNSRNLIDHYLIGKTRGNELKVDAIERYNIQTIDCDEVVLRLINKDAIIKYIKSFPRLYNVYGLNTTIKNVEDAIAAHKKISDMNDIEYVGFASIVKNLNA